MGMVVVSVGVYCVWLLKFLKNFISSISSNSFIFDLDSTLESIKSVFIS